MSQEDINKVIHVHNSAEKGSLPESSPASTSTSSLTEDYLFEDAEDYLFEDTEDCLFEDIEDYLCVDCAQKWSFSDYMMFVEEGEYHGRAKKQKKKKISESTSTLKIFKSKHQASKKERKKMQKEKEREVNRIVNVIEGRGKKEEIEIETVFYDKDDKGPYTVLAKKLGDQHAPRELPILSASRLLLKNGLNYDEISCHSWNTWLLKFKSFHEANAAVRNLHLRGLGFVLFIPRHKTQKKRVKNVPEGISLDELAAAINTEYPKEIQP